MRVCLPTILDTIFCAFITFVLSFVVLYYFLPRDFCLLYSICISLLLSLVLFKFFNKKNNQSIVKRTKKAECDLIVNRLNFSTIKENVLLFAKAIEKNGYIVQKRNTYLLIPEKKSAIFLRFSIDDITKSEILKIYNLAPKGYDCYVLSSQFSPPVMDFASRFNGKIKLINGTTCYEYLKSNDILPENKFDFLEKSHVKGSLKNLLYKKRAKPFLAFGLITLFYSFFVPLKIYYIIFGCMFLIASMYCRLFGKV